MNTISFASKLLGAKVTNGAIPFQVTVNLLDACNLKCEYCFCAFHQRHLKSIPFDRLMRLVDELADAGTVKINLAGGEPLLYKRVDEVIAKVRDRGVDCYVNTNGWYVEDHIEALRRITRINISLDGDRSSHDQARGEGSHARAVGALEIARREGIPRQITTVVGKHNLDQLDYLVGIAHEHDSQVVIVNMMPPRNLPPSKFALDDAAVRRLFGEVIRRKERGEPFIYSLRAMHHLVDWPFPLEKDVVFEGQEQPDDGIACQGGRFFCAVDTNGDLYPCCPTIGLVKPAPNIMDRSFAAAFASLRHHRCVSCNVPQSVDMNLLFGLSPSVVLNTMNVYKTPRKNGPGRVAARGLIAGLRSLLQRRPTTPAVAEEIA